MVKEVEFQNVAETIKVGDSFVPYTTEPALDIVSGFLEDDGATLVIDVNREIPVDYARRVSLYYANVDFAYSNIEYVHLGDSDLLTNDPSVSYVGSSFKFDITKVLSIPQRNFIQTPIQNIVIDLFTYEANVTDAEGNNIYKKRLSVPYKAVGDASTKYAISTDGWYVIGIVDYKIQKISEIAIQTLYHEGDILYWYEDTIEQQGGPTIADGELWMTTKDTVTQPGEGNPDWVIPTEEDLLNFILLPRPASITHCATILHADALISRYVKQNYIAKILAQTSFKPYDDDLAWYMADLLSSMREMALNYLEKGDGTKAKYMLDSMGNEFMAMMKGERKYERTLTQINYTV